MSLVIGVAVNDDNFKIFKSLLGEGLKALIYAGGAVVGTDDN